MFKFLIGIILIFSTSNVNAENLGKAYFAGGCFWCMEESFEKINGVKEVISGYSGGITENPTYREVTYGDTGHFEVVEIIYDKDVITYEELLKNFWININPFIVLLLLDNKLSNYHFFHCEVCVHVHAQK